MPNSGSNGSCVVIYRTNLLLRDMAREAGSCSPPTVHGILKVLESAISLISRGVGGKVSRIARTISIPQTARLFFGLPFQSFRDTLVP